MKTAGKIIIAEDEATIALDIRFLVEDLGYEVIGIVKRGEDLIEIVSRNEPSLIIADINLQGELDGIEALARIREKWKIPFIFITAYKDFERIIEIYNLNPCHLIYKPYDKNQLNECILECLEV
jgi:two-component SAPR family response regulator